MDTESIYKTSRHYLQKIAAVVLSAVILLVMLFSVWFIAEEAHHNCVGEDCPVCACIAACAETLHQLSGGTMKPNITAVIVAFAVVTLISAVKQIFLSDTLISQKIRQNN